MSIGHSVTVARKSVQFRTWPPSKILLQGVYMKDYLVNYLESIGTLVWIAELVGEEKPVVIIASNEDGKGVHFLRYFGNDLNCVCESINHKEFLTTSNVALTDNVDYFMSIAEEQEELIKR